MEDYPWYKNYDAGVPHTLQPYPARTMVDVVDESARARPYRAFLFFLGSKLLYDDFVHKTDALAAGLAASGVNKGDRVALVLPNCPQMVLGLHAVWKAGAIAVPINPYYTEHEMELAFNEVGVTVAIALAPCYNAVKNIQSRTSVRTVIATNIKEYLPAYKRILFGLFMEKNEGYRIELQHGDFWFQELMAKYKRSRRPDVRISPADPAVILFSGGTTGVPMGAVGTHQSMVMSAMQVQAWLKPVLEFRERTGGKLYCSEFGAYEAAPMPSRVNWYRDTVELFRKHDIGWSNWDFMGDFGIVGWDREDKPFRKILFPEG